MKKVLSVLLAVALLCSILPISVIPVEAASYTYDPDAAVAYAKAHYNDGKGLCAEFVSDCLKAGGFTAVYNKVARDLGRELQAYGTKITCSGWSSSTCLKASMFNGTLSKGDVIIWENKSGSSSSGHAMLYSGKTNSKGQILVYAHNSAKNEEVIMPSSSASTVYAIHLSSTSHAETPTISWWVADSEYGETPSSFKAGNRYWFCYRLYDSVSGKPWNEVAKSNYTVRIAFYNPNGSLKYDSEYDNYDEAWISSVFDTPGTYKYSVELTGDFGFSGTRTFTVQENPKNIHASTNSVSLALDGTKSKTIYVWTSGYYSGSTVLNWSRNNSNVTCSWGDWDADNKCPLTITGLVPGTTTITLSVKDKGSGAVLHSVPISVTVGESTKPTASISTTNNLATSQTVTLSMSDSYGIVGYYWGTSVTYSNNAYTSMSSTSSTSSISITKTISSAGTYYFNAKDVAGNISNTQSITFYKTILDANGGTVSPNYVITKSGNSITLPMPTKSGYTFLGWSTSSTATSATYQPGGSFTANSNTTLYAVWKANTYTLSYNANGGSNTPDSQTGAKSYTISSTVPTRFGYTFLGWAKSSSATTATYEPGDSITLTADTTLYAVWKAAASVSTNTQYIASVGFANKEVYYTFTPSVTTDYVFESTGSVDSKVYVYSSSGTELGNNDDGGNNNNFKLRISMTAGTKYYIMVRAYSSKGGDVPFKVIPVTYTITYNANGGSNAPGNQTKTHNVTLTLSSSTPTRSGYTFLGWATSSTATSATYQPSGYFTTNADTTLYAVWSKDTYTLSYSGNGGPNSPDNQTGAKSYTISSTVPTRFGYTFLGWSKSSSATTATYEPGDSITLTANTTLYAVWKAAASIFDYNLYTASVGFANQELYYIYTPTKSSDYVFEFRGSVDSKVYVYDAAGNELDSDDGSDEGNNFRLRISLSAGTKYYIKVRGYSTQTGDIKFSVRAVTYTITYSANGGLNAPDSQGKTHDVTLTLSSDIPTRSGYTFLGWSTSSTATSATYQPGGSFTINDHTVLYAVWKANTYTVSYNANGGSEAPSSQTKTHDVTLTLSSAVPTRSGYAFLGWSTSSTATSATYQPGGSFAANADTTLYAVWKCNHTYSNACDATCNTCGATRTPSAHVYSNNCDTTCNVCGATRSITHDYAPATCTTPKTCRVCGVTSGSALGHTWKDATCTAPNTCSTCGTTSGSALGHSYTSEVTKAPTCTATGVKTYTCSTCKHSYTESVAALGHTWNDATCTAPKTCSTCGATSGKALGHSYDGDSDADCNVCGAVREVETAIPGDANGDGKVNNKDLGLLQRYLNEWNVVLNKDTMDVNDDGKVNNKDLGLLQQHLNEWNVELK